MTATVTKKEKWERGEKYMDDYFKAIGDSHDTVSPGELLSFLLAALKILDPCLTEFEDSKFKKALLELKKRFASNKYQPLMSEINFFFSHDRYLSEDVEMAYTSLQNSRMIEFRNPEFRKFLSCFDEKGANTYLDRFIKRFKSFSLTKSEISNIAKDFKTYYEKQINDK